MKPRFCSRLLAVSGICLANLVFAGELKYVANDAAGPKTSLAASITDGSSFDAARLFSMPVVFRGTLGDAPVQAALRPKEIIEEGLEGEYFVFGRSQKILLAGELEENSIFLEESENGTNISGQWEGRLEGDSIHGTWLSADGSISKPFSLKLIRSQASSPIPAQTAPPTASATSATKR